MMCWSSTHWHLRLLGDRHVLARARKPDRARTEAAPRIRSEASGRDDQARFVERVGNAYRVTDKVNIPVQGKLQRRIDMVTETAKRLAELSVRGR
jgi:hypothetical protein